MNYTTTDYTDFTDLAILITDHEFHELNEFWLCDIINYNEFFE